LNICVVSGLLPTTGVPLPMFSYGGSSVLASLVTAAFLVRAGREMFVAEPTTAGRDLSSPLLG
ncbi:MAG: FtsW/RodA/SpoVE family cell cycle protein, partial [Cyanobacteria bacterium J06648_11]